MTELKKLQGRELRARTDIAKIEHFWSAKYYVESKTSGNQYLIDLADGPSCSCPDNQLGNLCKHIRAVAIAITEGEVPEPDR